MSQLSFASSHTGAAGLLSTDKTLSAASLFLLSKHERRLSSYMNVKP